MRRLVAIIAAAAAAESESSESLIGLRVTGVQNLDSLLADIGGGGTDGSASADARNPVVDAIQSPTDYQLPPLGAGGAADDPSAMIGRVTREIERTRPIVVEPHGYQYQTTR